MKTVIPMLLLAFIMQGQTQNYTPSTASFPNPERGYFHYASTGLVTSGYPALSQSTLNTYRSQNITVIQRTFYLNQFITSSISDTYLTGMQTDFTTIRNAGLKVIVRFAYSKSQTAAVLDATKSQILAHIQQVAPLIQANKDVISTYQYGWIGCWGETYYSSQLTEFGTGNTLNITDAQWANRKQILDAMLSSTPAEIPVQVRYIYAKQKMYPAGHNRIGFYNDAFLNVWGDSGTFIVSGSTGTPTTTDSNYVQTQTATLPMTGETDAINAPRTDCANAVIEMDKYNWSLLNKDYLTANITNWTSQGCFDETERRLGYRYELVSSDITNNTLTLKLQNSGYANVFKQRKAYLVLRNTSTNTDYPFEVASDLQTWTSSAQTQIVQSLNLAVPVGTYQLFLNLPDPNNANPLYSIQCANTGTWDAVNGYNNLDRTYTVTGTPTTTEPIVTAPTTGPVVTEPTTTDPTPTATAAVQIILVNNSTIAVSNLPSTVYTVGVYSTSGRLKSTSLDVSNLKRGIYIVKITCNGVVYSQKISKV